MRRIWRDVFYFSRADRRGCLVLLTVLFLLMGAGLWWLFSSEEPTSLPAPADHARFEAFLRSVRTDSLRRAERFSHTYEPYAVSERKPETFPFDPNTADSTELLRLGLTPWQVRNIYKYRARGGRYHRPEDFARLYGLSVETYDRLRPHIRIAERFRLVADVRPGDTALVRPDAPRYPAKVKSGTRLELNAADTASLRTIPGIGPALARRIVRYREALGGYARLEQLAEVEGLPEDVARWFFIHRPPTPCLNLNKASFDALNRHPYLDFYQTRIIVEHRRLEGPLRSLDDLGLYEEFPPAALERLRPYVCF